MGQGQPSCFEGLAGVVLTGSVMVIDNDTVASIGDNAKINEQNQNAGANQSVLVEAGHDVNLLAVAGSAGAGLGGGGGIGVGVTTLDNATS
jgi:hypothetical protein